MSSFDITNQVAVVTGGAGGNKPQATTTSEQPFFDLPTDALRGVLDLKLMGTFLPSQVFGTQRFRRVPR